MSRRVDLSQLAVPRGASPPAPTGGRRALLTRYLLPAGLLLGFAGLLLYALSDSFSPPRPVTVVPVLLGREGDTSAEPDTPLFQAAGWVEPRPTPTVVTALAEGVVERLLVVEGQEVKEGQPVALLIAADTRLMVEVAEADLKLREAELAGARATLTGARSRLETPLHLQADLAEAEAALARTEADLAQLPFQVRSAEARLEQARFDLAGKQRAVSSIPEVALSRSQAEKETAEAALEELKTRQKQLPAQVEALRSRRLALQERLKQKIDETRLAAEADAAVLAALARLKQATVALQAAQLKLERMTVRAPVAGRVLALVARPGSRLMGLIHSSYIDSSTVLTMYDPARLQVRADVRLDDVGKVQPGQKVKVRTAALPDRQLDGEVLFATSTADIQKNTLAVKVAVNDPPGTLKPEMLVQATFLAPLRPPSGPGEKAAARLLVPRSLVLSAAAGPTVWLADRATGRARLQALQLGVMGSGELVEVVSGLNSSDKLIVAGREGLKEGQRIVITGEDETLGMTKMTR
jgi:RND family efflux transporter MFP subunit